jgi:hypothetical protein
MRCFFAAMIAIWSLWLQVAAQSVGIGTASPRPSAQLEVSSTNKGLLPPRMTSAQRKAIANPTAGLMVFDTDAAALYVFNGDSWQSLTVGSLLHGTYSSRTLDIAQDAYFGQDVDVDGDWAVVGAPHVRVGDSVRNGAAYVFRRVNGEGWQLVQQLLPNSLDNIGLFGYTVAISGSLIAIGTFAWDENQSGSGDGEGAVFVYQRNASNSWNFLQKVTSTSSQDFDRYGISVDISSSHLIVGANFEDMGAQDNNEGAVYFYEWTGSSFSNELKLRLPQSPKPGDWFGTSVALSGSYAAVSATSRDIGTKADRGVVYIYVYGGGTWTFQDSVLSSTTSTRFGQNLDLQGNYLAVTYGSYSDETWNADVFLRSGSEWNFLTKEISDVTVFADDTNSSADVDWAFPYLIVGASDESVPTPYRGAVYVFELVSGQLERRNIIYDRTDNGINFGGCVAGSGNFIFIGDFSMGGISGGGARGKVTIATISD